MKNKKIALFINSLYGGGAERVVSRLSNELCKKCKLYIFLIEERNSSYNCAGTIVNLGCESKNYVINALHAFIIINRIIRQYNIDCVISFLDIPNIINCIRTHGIKKVASIRDYLNTELYKTKKEKIKFICLKNSLHKADRIISVSQELKSELTKYIQIDEEKICVIENPYDIKEIERLANEEIDKKLERFITGHKTAIAVGRLEEQKAYDDLVTIFNDVCKKEPNSALIILGEGSFKKDLVKMIKERHLEHQIKLLGWRENPFAYMSKCKIYVSCSLHEGFPNALVEAMACGLPVIHTDCKTGPREIIEAEPIHNNVTKAMYSQYGILIPSYTRKVISREDMQKEFASAWIHLLSSEELIKNYSVASKERAACFSMEKCRQKFQEVIQYLYD